MDQTTIESSEEKIYLVSLTKKEYQAMVDAATGYIRLCKPMKIELSITLMAHLLSAFQKMKVTIDDAKDAFETTPSA